MTTKSIATRQAPAGPGKLLIQINRNKPQIQSLIAVAGIVFVALLAGAMVMRFGTDLVSTNWERGFGAMAKPAQLGTFALMALWIVRLAVKRFRSGRIRTLFRLLQVAHTPIGIMVGVAALAHGLPLLLLHWEPSRTYYSGVVLSAAMGVVMALGLWSIYRRKPLVWHRWISLAAFALLIVHRSGH